MENQNDNIYDSVPSEPDDDFWLQQGQKMVEQSLPSVRDAAKSLMTGLGVLNAIYLGILGFSKLVPENAPIKLKSLFTFPLIFWLIALYCCLCVMMTEKSRINIYSPDNIRQNIEDTLKRKHNLLIAAFYLLTIGLVLAVVLAAFCPELQRALS